MSEIWVWSLGWGDPLEYEIATHSLVALMVKNLPSKQDTWVWSLGRENPLEKGMATQPVYLTGKFHGQRSLACYNPWGHRVGHDWAHILANTQQRTFPPQIPEIIRSIVLEPHFRSTASQPHLKWTKSLQKASCHRCLITTDKRGQFPDEVVAKGDRCEYLEFINTTL